MNAKTGSSPSSHTHPVARFLGGDAAIGGPFALLGVGYAASADQVLRGRDRKLAEIDLHQQNRTPDADEVRLAVHAAASQLLDEHLRSQLETQWPEGKHGAPRAWQSSRLARLPESILFSARMTMAQCGGWNARTRRRLAHLARIHRVPPIELIKSLGAINSVQRAGGSKADRPRIHFMLPQSTLGSWLVMYSMLLVMALVLAYHTFGSKPSPDEIHTADIQHPRDAQEQALGSLAEAKPAVSTKREIRHYSALLHEINQAAHWASTDPKRAAEQIAEYLPDFLSQWPSFPADDLETAALQITQVARYAEPFPEANRIITRALGSSASISDPIQVSATLALRRSVAASESDSVQFSVLLTDEFKSLARQTQSDDPAWWGLWVDAVHAVHKERSDASAELLIVAIEARLSANGSSRSWSKTATLLVNALSWRPSSRERVWMLGAFTEPAFSTPRLAELTSALTTHSSASGVQVSMVLKPNASMEDRHALADRYRDAWMRTGGKNDSFLDQLRDQLLIAISLTGPSLDSALAQKRIEELTRLNSVSWIYARGDHARAQVLLNTKYETSRPRSPASTLGLDHQDSDDQWALRLINADNTAVEMNTLTELASNGPVGLNTAHAVVVVAMTGSARESRRSAEQLIVSNSSSIPVLLALDEYLITRRTTERFRQVLGGVVPIRQEGSTAEWDRLAHRALLAKIANMVGDIANPQSAGFASLLASQYGDRVSSGLLSEMDIAQAAEQYIVALGASCLGVSVDFRSVERVMRIRRVRVARAKNVAQRFAADQWTIVELQSLYTMGSIPGSSAQVGQVLDELKHRLVQSESIEDQIVQLERAQSQLWLIALTEGRL